jgi:hypothetical protein
MIGLAPHRPPCVDGRQHKLLVQVPQYVRDAGRQVVVEQNGAGIEIGQAQAPVASHQRFEHKGRAFRNGDLGRLGDRGDERADAHVQA